MSGENNNDENVEMDETDIPLNHPLTTPNGSVVIPAELYSHMGKRKFDINMYATKKSAANGLLDLALLMANASQLKHIILTEGKHRFYYSMLTLLILSIVLQIGIGIALLVLARYRVSEDNDGSQRKRNELANKTNNIVVASIFILTVLNVFISAFGLNASG